MAYLHHMVINYNREVISRHTIAFHYYEIIKLGQVKTNIAMNHVMYDDFSLFGNLYAQRVTFPCRNASFYLFCRQLAASARIAERLLSFSLIFSFQDCIYAALFCNRPSLGSISKSCSIKIEAISARNSSIA